MTINLQKNENPYPLSENIKEAAIKGLEKANRYSEPKDIMELKELLGQYNNVPTERIVLSHGSNLLLREIINIFSKDRKIIRINPSFFPVTQYALKQATRITKIQISPPNFDLDPELLLNELSEPSLIIIDNPNNPTGKILINEDTAEKVLKNKDVLLVVDEAYYEFSGQTFASMLEKYPRLAIARTMDKAFSLAGLRMGYLLMGDYFKEHFSDFPVNLSTPTLFAAIESLNTPEYMTANVAKILAEKIRIEKELLKIGIQVFPGKANFILIKTNTPGFGKKLKDEGLNICNLADDWINGYYRISIGIQEENNKLLSIIKTIGKDV
ncbi:histidinol-phosphate transaminase [Ancylomarina sp. 16SWW S1-10-2]|uniref:pyridoxal phosphate-dependent aminotransferase n=1 Tax=Ancylomarina sp. 16SWW S1-10-2 TaxID=2499681 RepID=UPI0012AE5015|nr:aminotransferase class I/II-fold pyridoxal phosphate-dependent enzyme [Ancylomarina sp. 16SWW S1-10-2]MRT92514.1 aminotransferase class I/II-fold pyridoxal phosphate-dependent enzyme [Ancylomarina sp. 16SWW S1-10-2]